MPNKITIQMLRQNIFHTWKDSVSLPLSVPEEMSWERTQAKWGKKQEIWHELRAVSY